MSTVSGDGESSPLCSFDCLLHYALDGGGEFHPTMGSGSDGAEARYICGLWHDDNVGRGVFRRLGDGAPRA